MAKLSPLLLLLLIFLMIATIILGSILWQRTQFGDGWTRGFDEQSKMLLVIMLIIALLSLATFLTYILGVRPVH